MSDKNFKIRPTTWPKEYTFEEFKQLNPFRLRVTEK